MYLNMNFFSIYLARISLDLLKLFGIFISSGNFPAVIFSDTLFVSCFLSSPSGTVVKCMLTLVMLTFMSFIISSVPYIFLFLCCIMSNFFLTYSFLILFSIKSDLLFLDFKSYYNFISINST